VAELSTRHHLREATGAMITWGAALLVMGAFGWLLLDVFRQGVPRMSFAFLLDAPSNAGREGGIGPIIVSTALIVLVGIVAALPIGLGAAIFLSELAPVGSRVGRLVRRSLDALAAVPSIVFGLFGNAFFSGVLGLRPSILSGGLTLTCMVLPILIRTTEVGLRAVPQSYRHGAAALALGRTTTLIHIVLPVALPALVAGLVLGVGRAIAETAALIFTSGYVDRMPGSLLDSGRSISVHIYDLAMNVPGGNASAYASALTLIIALVAINLATAGLLRRFSRAEAT